MKKQILLLPIVLMILSLALSACGGSNQGPKEINITVEEEFFYAPDSFSVKAGEELTIVFENTGTLEHTFNILKANAELEHILKEAGEDEHVDEELLLDIHEIAAGGNDTATFTAPMAAGEYTFACLVPGHAEAGMVGTMTVTP